MVGYEFVLLIFLFFFLFVLSEKPSLLEGHCWKGVVDFGSCRSDKSFRYIAKCFGRVP